MEDEKYVRIPLKNAYKGLASRLEFEDRLDFLTEKLNSLDIKALLLNNREMLDIENTIACLRSMSVNQVVASEILVRLN